MEAETLNALSERIIGCAIEVHTHLGPGLLESAYEACLVYELTKAGLSFERQKPISVVYKDVTLDCGYRIDLLVEGEIIVELKSVEEVLPIHQAQVITYLKLADKRLGLLMNFNSHLLSKAVKRLVNDFPE